MLMFETMAQFIFGHLYGRVFDPPMGPVGSPRQISKKRRHCRTKDGLIALMA